MDLKLRGKRVLVTGSTVGIGFAIAQGLAKERAEVIVNGRTEQKVAEAVQRISSEVGSPAIGIAADLSSAEGVAWLVAQAGRVDILVNNVGIFWPVPFLEISDQDWFHIFEVNVMSGVRLSRELLPAMLKRNWGRIIFVSSESGLQIPSEMVHYGVTKRHSCTVPRHRRDRRGYRSHREFGPAGADQVGRRSRFPRQGRGRTQHRYRRGRGGIHPDHAANLPDPPLCRVGGGRKPGGVSLRRRGLGNYRRFTASRWRRGAQHGLRRPAAWR